MNQTERLMRLETNVDNINTSLNRHSIEQREDFDKVLKKLDNLDKRFAGKWTEKVLITIVTGVAIAIIVAVL
jgi:predicted  nucleic acid-binding Zn-ribbon protein